MLQNSGGRQQWTPSRRALGIPPSLEPRRGVRVAGTDERGVILPARPATNVAVPDPTRTRRLPTADPEITEYAEHLFQVAGVARPVIDSPEPPRQQPSGPVIGYRAVRSH